MSNSTASEMSCDRPHVVEVLGTTSVGMDPVAVTDLRAACITYAGLVLRTADPTRQGAVSMDIVGDDRAFAGLPSATYLPTEQVQDARVSCYAQAGEGSRFDGTLVGIGMDRSRWSGEHSGSARTLVSTHSGQHSAMTRHSWA